LLNNSKSQQLGGAMPYTDFQVQTEQAATVVEHSSSVQSLTVEEIQDWLAHSIAEQLDINPDEIDLRSPFNSYGLSSMQAMSIATQGKQQFGVALSPLVMWSFPNIETLSEYLAKELAITEVEVFEI
jgi:acyl carrier protein